MTIGHQNTRAAHRLAPSPIWAQGQRAAVLVAQEST
jgi:hypothetical protein